VLLMVYGVVLSALVSVICRLLLPRHAWMLLRPSGCMLLLHGRRRQLWPKQQAVPLPHALLLRQL
jgi:hypothetical protein